MALTLPALPPELQAEVAAGEASWTLALGVARPGPRHGDPRRRARQATASGSSRAPSGRCWPRPTRRARSAADGRSGIRRLAGPDVLPEIRRRGRAALALEACGVARRALELGVEHASTREQFGKPIGIYQAISHPLADTFAEVELARSLALWAAWCVAEGDGQAEIACAAAKAYAAEAAVAACERSIQVHGGTGFTWEHVLHRLYKRALWIHAFDALARSASLRGRRGAPRRGRSLMDGLMMDYQLTLPTLLRRAETFFGDKEIATRLPGPELPPLRLPRTWPGGRSSSRSRCSSSASSAATASRRSAGTTTSTSRRTSGSRAAASSCTR